MRPTSSWGPDGSRTVFDRSTVTEIRWKRQQKVDPADPQAFSEVSLSISRPLDVVPGGVGTIAFGRYSAPDYRVHPGEFIPAVGTRSGTPLVRGTNEITFVLYLPSVLNPMAGIRSRSPATAARKTRLRASWSRLTWQSGDRDDRDRRARIRVRAAQHVCRLVHRLEFHDLSSGGRALDQNGDRRIVAGEGFGAAPPRANLDTSGRDGHRQWVADHMQLVREIEVGMDVDGDTWAALDPSRICYLGHSVAGVRGPSSSAVEPNVRAGVLSVPTAHGRAALRARGGFPPVLQSRVPSVINSPGITSVNGIPVPPPSFNENLPLRMALRSPSFSRRTAARSSGHLSSTRSPVPRDPPVLDDIEWASQSASSIAYASHLRRDPLNGVPAKSVIIQFAYGDRLVPNPSTTALLHAGDLADRATFFRTDIAFPVPPPFLGRVLRRPCIHTSSWTLRSRATMHTSKTSPSTRSNRSPRSSISMEGTISSTPTTGIRSPILMTRVRSLRCLSNHLCLKPSTITASDLTSGTEAVSSRIGGVPPAANTNGLELWRRNAASGPQQ